MASAVFLRVDFNTGPEIVAGFHANRVQFRKQWTDPRVVIQENTVLQKLLEGDFVKFSQKPSKRLWTSPFATSKTLID